MILLLLVLCIVGVFFTTLYYKRKRHVDLGNRLAGPRTIPLLGNGHIFVNKNSEGIFKKLIELHLKYGDTFRLWFGPVLWVVESNPKHVEEIITSSKHITKSVDYSFFEPWLGRGLLLSSGSRWLKTRKVITPAFHSKILDQFLEIYDSQTDETINKLKFYTNGETIDLHPYIKRCTLAILCETSMGVKLNPDLDSDLEYLKAVQKASEIVNIRLFDGLSQNDAYFSITRNGRILKKVVKVVHDFTDNVIVKRRKELLKNKSFEKMLNPNFDLFEPKKKTVFLDILLLSQIDSKFLTDEQIREEVNTFLFSGHDTTASALTFLLYNLAKHQCIQEKVYREIINVTGNDRRHVSTNRHISSLKYMDLVIKESIRLYPPVPLIGRQLLEEVKLSDGVIYPANTNYLIGIMLMHRNPKLFPDPDSFKPERFENEIINEKLNLFSYIPFSAGPRNCIGQRFAQQEIKVFLCRFLKAFKIRLSDENEELLVYSEIVLKSKHGLNVILEPRTLR